MNGDATVNLLKELQKFGVSGQGARLFSSTMSPELFDYLDLIEPGREEDRPFLKPDGVAENQGRPLLFFVNESRLAHPENERTEDLLRLRRSLACRGDRAYLAVIRPGSLDVVPVSLADQTPKWKQYHAGTGEAISFFSRLAMGKYDGEGEPDTHDIIFKEMFELLNVGADRVAHRIGRADTLSLVGRALFFRFLLDRAIVKPEDVKKIAPQAKDLQSCFDDPANAFHTCQWLDRTFNGDFLPLKDGGSQAFFDGIGQQSKSAYESLKAIVRGAKPIGATGYQLTFDWGDFDFAHIPVGLLSQIYEAFCWKWEHKDAKETSVHYTPRNIAATLVEEAFDGIPDAHKCRVLDPACGASVFLVLAFRRLYHERWKATGKRPDTKGIRDILDNQLVGFDISESALKLSALSLYLTAIELDPKPAPPEKLRFKALKNRVLFNHRREGIDPETGPVIGSLGDHVGNRFDGQFDLVLSNPPWTSLKKEYKALAGELTRVSREVIERQNEPELAKEYENPDSAPDLPFLWKSMEWCKADGRIAMALPARILLKQEEIPSRARQTLFRQLALTGVINGSNLSDTNVWPEMNQPFLLLFARNSRPTSGASTRLISPLYDNIANSRGEVRIDSKSVMSVFATETVDEPWLWKALCVGTTLDAEVVRRIRKSVGTPLKTQWSKEQSGKGYQIVSSGDENSASFLLGLPDLNSTTLFRFEVSPKALSEFAHNTVHRPRKESIYEPPLVLVKEAPGEDRTCGWAFLAFEKIAYNESFCGYSASGNPEAGLLVRYLHLFVHSSIWIHYALHTSAKFGAERRRFYKADLDDCPFVPLDLLSVEQKRTIEALSNRILEDEATVFGEIDAFFGAVYGLGKLDLEVIRDTLEVCLPYDSSRRRACSDPSNTERNTFRRRIESVLRPFFKVLGKDVQVAVPTPSNGFLRKESPFGIVLIGEQGSKTPEPDHLLQEMILRLADDTGATRIIQRVEGGLVVGILNQYRYWTPSRARLLAAEIVRQHMGIFED